MCRWMGLYFHDWIDYNGVAFSIEFLEWGRTCNCAVLSCGPAFTNMQKNMLLSMVIIWSAVYTFSRFFKHVPVYVVVNFYVRWFLFFLCFNFISFLCITIHKNKRKSKITWDAKLTTTYIINYSYYFII